MKLPQTHVLTPAEVREAFSEWVSKHKLDPFELWQTVHITVAWHSDGSATVMLDHPVSDVPPKETVR